MEIILLLLLPILVVWLELFNARAQEKEELLLAKKEMWEEERIGELWEKELKLRVKLYEEIFGEEHEYTTEMKKETREKGVKIVLILVFWIWIFSLFAD